MLLDFMKVYPVNYKASNGSASFLPLSVHDDVLLKILDLDGEVVCGCVVDNITDYGAEPETGAGARKGDISGD